MCRCLALHTQYIGMAFTLYPPPLDHLLIEHFSLFPLTLLPIHPCQVGRAPHRIGMVFALYPPPPLDHLLIERFGLFLQALCQKRLDNSVRRSSF